VRLELMAGKTEICSGNKEKTTREYEPTLHIDDEKAERKSQIHILLLARAC
jgi:hypothetical protein